jgi:glycosyltransferase involved in cell wall biosynthesis
MTEPHPSSGPRDGAGTPPHRPGYSFCIITHGKRPDKLRREIESIRAQRIPNSEILVGGEIPADLGDDLTVVPSVEAARAGRLGEMRNQLAGRARFDHLVMADDDLIFHADFHRGLQDFGEDYDVMCVRVLSPDGTRYWDWTTFGGPRGHVLLDYTEDDPFVYASGAFCVMKAAVFDRVKWDERLGFYQGEDVEFSRRLREAGFSIKFNIHSSVTHDDPRYTQIGRCVFRVDDILRSAHDNYAAPNRPLGRDLLSRAVRLFPDDFDIWCQAGQTAIEARDLRAARQHLRRAAALDPARAGELAPLLGQVDEQTRVVSSARQEGRYVYLDESLLAQGDGPTGHGDPRAAFVDRLVAALDGIGPFYAHVGGAGDALLLLATFLDRDPEAQVVSLPNSLPAAKAVFEAFPSLKRVVLLPPSANPQTHLVVRWIFCRLPNCLGAGATPDVDHDDVWTTDLDIFEQYGVVRRPDWIRQFRTRPDPAQVALAPKGSLSGMLGSKRNVIPPEIWRPLLQFVMQQGFRPVILGTPDEREEYVCPEACTDRRSYSFRSQMEVIANSALFVGADSWGKTFSALAGKPTLVFEPIRGPDWKGRKDASDFVFLHPWETIVVVKDFGEMQQAFRSFARRSEIGTARNAALVPEASKVPSENAGAGEADASARQAMKTGRRLRPIRVVYDTAAFEGRPGGLSLAPEPLSAAESVAVALLTSPQFEVVFSGVPKQLIRPVDEFAKRQPELARTQQAATPAALWVHRQWTLQKEREVRQGCRTLKDKLASEFLRVCRKSVLQLARHRYARSLRRAEILHLPFSSPLPEVTRSGHPPVFRVVRNVGPLRSSVYFGRLGTLATARRDVSSRRKHLWFLTHSQYAKDQICAELPDLDPARIFVVRLFVPAQFRSPESPREAATALHRYDIPPEPYFVCRCGPGPRRDLWRVITAFGEMVRQPGIPRVNLVLLGAEREALEFVLEAPEIDPILRLRVFSPGEVPRQDLPALYAGAVAFFYLSSQDGLGLSLMEAMQCGAPAAAVSSAFVPELIGDAGLLIDPEREGAICDAMHKLLQDAPLREWLSKRSLERAGEFTVERCREDLMAAYEAALSPGWRGRGAVYEP